MIATSEESTDHLAIYGLRWEIESLFDCLKGRGFRFEDPRLTEAARIDKLTTVLALTFAWAHQAGEWHHIQVKAIRRKKPGRLAMSNFRYGLDQIQRKLIQTCIQ